MTWGIIHVRSAEKSFSLSKKKKYIVCDLSIISFSGKSEYEAFDCPCCGCQNVMNKRFPELLEAVDTKEED